MKYVCDICGYVYDPAAGDPDNGVAPGTPWEAVPRRLGLPAVRRRQGPVQPRSITQNEKRKPVTRLPLSLPCALRYISSGN